MARYIDAEALESELFRDGIAGIFLNYPRRIKFTIGEIRGMLKNERIAPTADVVPRSEVERWYAEYHKVKEDLKQEKMYHKSTEKLADRYLVELKQAKQEVAREMSAEMEHEIAEALKSNYKALSEFEEADELYYRVKGKIDALRGIQDFLAELEKKYIGE